jgi:hypothetical protein
MTTIIALTIDWFDDDGGGETKPAVIIDGETYRIVELRRGLVVPRRQSSSPSSLYHPSECAYWLQSELCGAIYGRIRRGTVLLPLDQPVPMSTDVKGSAVVEVGWMSASVHVAIKEMSWELVGEHRSTLAKNPIKEIAAMQYLQAFVGDKRRRRRRRGRKDDEDYLGHGHGGEGASNPARQSNVVRAGRLRLPGQDHPKATGAAMRETCHH